MKTQQLWRLMFGSLATAAMLSVSTAVTAAPSADFRGGKTSVALSQDFVGALTALKVTPGTIGSGRLSKGVASFPIVSGAGDLGTVKLEVNHSGGLSLTAGKTIVELTDYSITNLDGKLVLTGLVKANDDLVGRIPLFDLTLSSAPKSATVHSGLQVTVSDVKVTLNKTAAGALNGVFKLTAFKEGLNIGAAKVRGLAK